MKNILVKLVVGTSLILFSVTGSVAFAMDSISNWNAADGLPGSFWTGVGSVGAPTSGALTIETTSNSDNTYFLENKDSNASFSTTAGLSIEARLSYITGSSSHDARDSVVIGITQGNNWGNGFFIGNDQIFILSDNLVKGAFAAVDTHGFHTYRIDVGASDGNSASSFNVFYDGQLKLTGTTYNSVPANGPDQGVYWGEGSVYAYGKSEWQFVRNVTPVPEPETYAMLLAGLGLMYEMARHRKQKVSTA